MDCCLSENSVAEQSKGSSDSIIISEISNDVNSIDSSFSNVLWMDWSDDLGILDFELLEQDIMVFDSSSSKDRLVYGFKSFVVNTKSDEMNCLDKGLEVSSVDISYVVQSSELVSAAEFSMEIYSL